MKMIFLSLVFLSSFAEDSTALADNLPYLDQQFSCSTQEEAQGVARDLNIDVKSFGGLELCNAQIDFKKLLNDLVIIKNGKFSASGANLFIRNFIPPERYYDWMKSMTRGMRRGNEIPSATAYNSSGYFTMQEGWAKLSTLGRVGTVLHEARHTENYRHIPCHQGPYMNSSMQGCDENYTYGGSHAIEMEYYARVATQGQNFHPVYKSMARLMAIARSNFVFNSTPIRLREGLFTLDKARQKGLLIDNVKTFAREVPTSEGLLKRTSFGASLFSGQKAYAIEMYGTTGGPSELLDTYSYFKLLLSFPIQVKDFEEFDFNLKRYAVAITNTNKLISFDFPTGKWGSEVVLNLNPVKSSTALDNGETGYFLIDDQLSIHKYDPTTHQVSPVGRKWNADIVSIAKINQRLYFLKTDGKVYEKSSSGNLEVSSIPQENFSSMLSVPLYDGFEVVL